MKVHISRHLAGGIALLASALVVAAAVPDVWAETPGPVRFNRDIRPIMSDTCFKCHGPGTQQADLRLDVRDLALQEASSGATPVVPGKPDNSEIIRRIFAEDGGERMPPEDAHKSLTDEQKQLMRRWVAEGAPYEKHWSFEPLANVTPPAIEAADYRIHNPIDAFIAARLQQEGLAMTPSADRPTLIRRVAFTLTGLPPTAEQVDRFVNDTGPRAYAEMVERYLASPHYGEEMARHWLDVARYADTHGLHLDNERQVWPYRDWVIRSYNDNQPFDQFTLEQLAGDLLPDASLDQLTATGFIRCNVTTGEGGSIEEEWVFRNAVDRTSTMIEAWLGLTGGCAVCHDHKFDPLTSKEFYSLYAFFHSAADPALDGNALLTPPSVKLVGPQQQRQLNEFDARIASVRSELETAAAATDYTDPATLNPPPATSSLEVVWLDDDTPAGAKVAASPGHPTSYITSDQGPVKTGARAIRRSDAGLAQDVFEGVSLEVPSQGRLFAHVWLDGQNPPQAIMLQYFKDGWLHRAVWGNYDLIPWGRAGTTERVHMGALPAPDQWVRLEVPAEQLGLSAGDVVTGFALTQHGGTVYWDQIGAVGLSDPASDPRRSLTAWWKQQTGKDTPGAPAEVNAALKAGPVAELADDVRRKLTTYYLVNVCEDTRPAFAAQQVELTRLAAARRALEESIPATVIYRELDTPRDSFVMLRGQYNKPGDPVTPDTPAVLPPLKKADGGQRATRLELARWLTSDEQPLTPRVTVNRFWQQVFGTGLVKTSFDFGSQGEVPSHPELLDWLAVEFRDGGWNIKQLMRLMLNSATFQQSSAVTAELIARDPANRLYARGPRLRLDAEQIRDNALMTSGLLSLDIGGPGVKPYQPPNIWEPVGFVGSNTRDYKQDQGQALYRRSIYTFFKRTAPPPFMANFDAPNREQFCTVRERSNTPLQALQLMNDVQHFEAARSLGRRMIVEGGETTEQRIVFGFRVVLGRTPSEDELAIVQQALAKHLESYQRRPEAAQQAIAVGDSNPPAELPATELAAYALAANLLLNLDETITRN